MMERREAEFRAYAAEFKDQGMLREALGWLDEERQISETAMDAHEEACVRIADLEAEVARLTARLERLLSGYYGFVGHVDACRVQVAEDCTCGFEALRAGRAGNQEAK